MEVQRFHHPRDRGKTRIGCDTTVIQIGSVKIVTTTERTISLNVALQRTRNPSPHNPVVAGDPDTAVRLMVILVQHRVVAIRPCQIQLHSLALGPSRTVSLRLPRKGMGLKVGKGSHRGHGPKVHSLTLKGLLCRREMVRVVVGVKQARRAVLINRMPRNLHRTRPKTVVKVVVRWQEQAPKRPPNQSAIVLKTPAKSRAKQWKVLGISLLYLHRKPSSSQLRAKTLKAQRKTVPKELNIPQRQMPNRLNARDMCIYCELLPVRILHLAYKQ